MTTLIHQRVDAAQRNQHPGLIARLPSGWAIMGDAQFLRGYCLLLPDPVVPTLNHLSPCAREIYLADMARLGDAVLAVCKPLRINYEILGNLEPSLHAHIIPRYADEPEHLRTKPIWLYPDTVWTDPAHAFNPVAHGALRESIREALLTAPSSPNNAAEPPLWRHAASFAARAHAGQLRKDNATPYFAHPCRVTLTVRDIFNCDDPICLAAALLHDTIEDTPADYDDILEHFGPIVADCVAALTKDMRLPEHAREPAYDKQLAAADWRAALIKLADVLDNTADAAHRTDSPDPAKLLDKARRAIAVARPHAPHHPPIARAIAILDARLSPPIPR